MIYPKNFEQKIEFSSIRELLKGHCLSPLGRQRVDEMEFMLSLPPIKARLDETGEFMRILQGDDFPGDHYLDVRPSLRRVTVPGTYLSEEELFSLRRSLETIGKILAFLRAGTAEDETEGDASGEKPLYPALRALAGEADSFPHIVKNADRLLTPFGQMKDSASPQLADVRRQLSATAGSISRTLQRILAQAQSDGLVEKDVSPTLRDGRLVIPVAGGMKRRIRGIVHDESASGKTAFVEPAEVVEANNRIRELEAEERREIVRILTAFTDELRPDIEGLLGSYEFMAEVDFTRAKARLALQTGGTVPHLSDKPCIDWGAATHPLLQLSLAKQGKKVVPLDIALDTRRRILLISGPNAGGKSVCLKTVGLLQYMLQCGLPVPMREGSRAGLFASLFIDIGDEQSIENDLSTYSSHLQNMKVMLKQCDNRSLILIDEFGGGTEPLIGGAMAEAMLHQFNQRGTLGVITTHYQNLKQMAGKTEGIVNGAMLYDRQQMQPLFQLQTGNPGSSFAIEIARKTGVPEEVIRHASEIVGQDYIQSDKYLQDIVRDKRYWESKRQTIHRREKELEELIEAYKKEKEEFEQTRKATLRQAGEAARQLIDEANAKIENTIRSIVEAKAEKERTREARRELADFRQQIEERAAREQEEKLGRKMKQLIEREQRRKEKKERQGTPKGSAAPQGSGQQGQPPTPQLKAGDYVTMVGQSTTGQIEEVKGSQAVVIFGMMRTTVATARLRPAEAPQQDKMQAVTYISRQTQEQIYDKKLNFKQDIDLRGMRGDEAVRAVTYFIDDALLLRVPRVRILHGTGNGILRTLIRQYLRTVPGVADFRDEHVQFGGAGITVVDLSD